MYGYSPFMAFGFGYIKKEDARILIQSRKIAAWVIGICMALVLGVMHFIVAPKLLQVYQEVGYQFPGYIVYDLPIGLALSALIIFLAYPNQAFVESFNRSLKKYKSGEMIMIRNLVSTQNDFIVMVLLFLFTALFLVSYIMPIYDLTSKI